MLLRLIIMVSSSQQVVKSSLCRSYIYDLLWHDLFFEENIEIRIEITLKLY